MYTVTALAITVGVLPIQAAASAAAPARCTLEINERRSASVATCWGGSTGTVRTHWAKCGNGVDWTSTISVGLGEAKSNTMSCAGYGGIWDHALYMDTFTGERFPDGWENGDPLPQ
ncbi:hypothetical protein AB0J63_49265 [Streptosporangium canum]|uniref:hypothetical protein n=1 Tax=Streptosporangium canum TaxID=324952 RepID=UPI0034398049